MPQTPKPPGQRRRRNKDQPTWRKLPAEGRDGKAPSLPEKKPAWLKTTRAWWAEIWKSPMATMWSDADVESLVRMARLKDKIDRGKYVAAELAALQKLEDSFGLNPLARRRLQWEIEKGTSADDQQPLPNNVRRIRAVDPSGAKAS